MSEKPKLDIIIFGATGYTGKCVLTQFIKLNRCRYSWAVAGRNHEKLKELLEWATVKSGKYFVVVSFLLFFYRQNERTNELNEEPYRTRPQIKEPFALFFSGESFFISHSSKYPFLNV